jgi:hypothetical protein
MKILERVFRSFFQDKKIQKIRYEIFIQGQKWKIEGYKRNMEWVLFHKDNMSFSDPLSRKIVTLPMSEL